MVRDLLVRGMLVGLAAGLLTFMFAEVFGEPQVDRAIAFEEQSAAAEPAPILADATTSADGHTHMVEGGGVEGLVSRRVQGTIGLATGVLVHGAAMGGLFALVFAFAYGRLGDLGPRGTAAMLAALGFVVIFLVPAVKYPPNPPAVGDPDTIGLRSGLFLLMILFSLMATAASMLLRPRLVARWGSWNGTLLTGALFLALITVVQLVMPTINEVPDAFPAVVLWHFRTATLSMQLVMWASLGLLFGSVAERTVTARRAAIPGR